MISLTGSEIKKVRLMSKAKKDAPARRQRSQRAGTCHTHPDAERRTSDRPMSYLISHVVLCGMSIAV
jgi:hypothetical protein